MRRLISFSLALLAILLSVLLVWRFVFPELLRRNRLKPVVSDLRSQDLEAREKAAQTLESMGKAGLTAFEGRYALSVAGEPFPPLKEKWRNSANELVSAAAGSLHPSFVAPILTHFASYPAPAQGSAIRLLASIHTRAAAEAVVQTLQRCADDADPGELRGLSDEPRHADVLYPAILGLLSRDSLRWPVLKLTLDFLEARQLTAPEAQRRIAEEVGAVYQSIRPALLAAERTEGTSWLWEDESRRHGPWAGLVVDVLGHLSAPYAEPLLRRVLEHRDPRLRLFAALGLLRSGHEVSIPVLAGSLVCRVSEPPVSGTAGTESAVGLPARVRHTRVPRRVGNGNWLIFPTELARAPDEIELMAVVPATSRAGPTDYYLFRFRTFPPSLGSQGWLDGGRSWSVSRQGPTNARRWRRHIQHLHALDLPNDPRSRRLSNGTP